ncbi:MAG: hypothetical protein ACLVHV_02085 [Oscillospiraceae bacterium]
MIFDETAETGRNKRETGGHENVKKTENIWGKGKISVVNGAVLL